MELLLNPLVLAALFTGTCSLLLRRKLNELLKVLQSLRDRLE
jgi:hypothetical protein